MLGSSHSFVRSMGREMFKKWDKYWQCGSMLLAIACILDPRCKMAVVEYYFESMYSNESAGFIASLNACLNALFKEYLEAHSKTNQNQASSSSHRPTSANVPTVSNTRAGLKDFIRGRQTTEPLKTELEQYLSDPLDETSLDDCFDILGWWKVSATKYLVLSRLTRDVLAVPVSTVASEAAFSNSGRTLSSVRNSLNDESMKALICAQDCLKASITKSGGVVGEPLWISEDAATEGIVGTPARVLD